MADPGRRQFCQIALGCAAFAAPLLISAAPAQAKEAEAVLKSINSRRSVRAYKPEPVSQKDIDSMLYAAMMAPSAMNEQPWEFVVINDPAVLKQIGEAHRNARYAKKSPLAILVCYNEQKEKLKGMGVIDASLSAQNLMLAAHALGLGSVFTASYPVRETMDSYRGLLNLPGHVVPLGLVIIGHPEIPGARETPERFNKAAIHANKW